jgi:hypothetical protein
MTSRPLWSNHPFPCRKIYLDPLLSCYSGLGSWLTQRDGQGPDSCGGEDPMRTRYSALAIPLVFACSLSFVVDAAASSISLTVEVPDPNKKFEAGSIPVLQLILGSQLTVGSLTINAPWTGGTSAEKATVINTALFGTVATAPPVSSFRNVRGTIDPKTPNTLTVSGLPNAVKGKNKTKVTFKPGKSGEGVVDPKTGIGKDILFTAGDPDGAIGFQNSAFASLDGAGNPSTFTAGVLTDAGELFVTVDATQLANPQGGTIVQALFNLLNPSLSGRGVQIVGYTAGDDILNFTFDPAKTQIAGVIFGTTAESDGVFGTIEAGQVPAPASVWLLIGGMFALAVLGWMSNATSPCALLQRRRLKKRDRAAEAWLHRQLEGRRERARRDGERQEEGSSLHASFLPVWIYRS